MKKAVSTKKCIPDYQVEDEHDFFAHHSVSHRDLLELSGGVPVDEDFPLKCTITTQSKNFVSVKVESSIYSCERSFNFAKKIIVNDFLKVYSTGRGIGRILFTNQLLEARRLNFETITLHAVGGNTGNDWNGFILGVDLVLLWELLTKQHLKSS